MVITMPRANHLHAICSRAKVRYIRVDHPLFRQFSDQTRLLLRQLGEDQPNDPEWSDLVRLVKRYRYAAAATPLAFNNPAIYTPGLFEQIDEIVNRLAISYGNDSRGLLNTACAVREDIFNLGRCGDRPLGIEVEHLVEGMPQETVAVLLSSSRLVDDARRSLHSFGCSVDVVAAATARDLTDLSRIIVLGPARWFPEHIFAAPRAPEIWVVGYQWLRCRWERTNAFIGGVRGVPSWQVADESEDGTEDETYATDWSHLAVQVRGDGMHPSDAFDSVAARLFTLHGGFAVTLEADSNSFALVIDVEADEGHQVYRVSLTNVYPGMFLLLRTEGSGDYVPMVADRLLGPRAAVCRQAQRRWKELLRTRVRQSSALQVALQLLDLGSTIADEANVRRWCSDYGIATAAKSDFTAIARLVGLDDAADTYWRMMREIRKAHVEAGGRIRRQLLAEVSKADLRKLELEGRMEFALPDADGGKLTAFRIEGRSPNTVEMPRSKMGQAFRVEP